MYNPPLPFYSPPRPFNHQIHTKEHAVKTKQLDVAKGLKSQKAWLSSSKAKQRADAAKADAISEFKKRFPRADVSRFQEEVEFDANHKATATVLFTDSDGSQTNPLIKGAQILLATSDGCFANASRRRLSNTVNTIYAN